MSRRQVLVTGGTGQIGIELGNIGWPEDIVLHRPDRSELDLACPESIAECMASQPWSAIINCAGWTAVDTAEDNVGATFLANAQGPAWLAEAARKLGAAFIQVSTDYVFSGELDRPYLETDPVGPVGVYGASKLSGELAVRSALPRAVVLRTAWVVSAHRHNFVKTMLQLGAERDCIKVVDDQRGCPTSASDIAAALQSIVLRLLTDPAAPAGVFHFVNAGSASWHELANAIFDIAVRAGRPRPEVVAIRTADYPTRAARPANSRLDTSKITREFGIVPRDWQTAVAEIIDGIVTGAEQRTSR